VIFDVLRRLGPLIPGSSLPGGSRAEREAD